MGLSLLLLALYGSSGPLLASSHNTESGNINVGGTVPTAPPSTAPTIGEPANGATFTQKNITVKGTCIAGLIVKIFSNNIFVGSTVCDSDGTYQLQVDLFINKNDLIARQYDMANQPSPDSTTITVFYVPQQPKLPEGEEPAEPGQEEVARFQLTIAYDFTTQGVFVNQPFRIPIHFMGGTGPYTVTVDWGDGSSNTYQRQNTDKFPAEYTYTRGGVYTVVIKVTDSTGEQAYLQFVVIVHGTTDSPVVRLFGQEVSKTFFDAAALTIAVLLVAAVFIGGYMSGRSRHRKSSNIDKLS